MSNHNGKYKPALLTARPHTFGGFRDFTAATRIWWKKSFIKEKQDEKDVRFGDKTTTLEAVGLLLPFLTNPKMLVNKHIVLKVDGNEK